MKIIVPMAGMGKRMRPHTLTVPKPLIPIAGKPIVQRLVEDIAKVTKEKIEEIAFVIGDFGKEVEETLCEIARSLHAEPKIYYQDEPLGTAHAIYCAEPSLDGKVVVAFADTLFIADFEIDNTSDGIIWVHKVKDPCSFGVVKINKEGIITDFIEKPKTPVSDLAIIGIYYFSDGAVLKKEIKYLLDNKVVVNGEYQLTDVLQRMKDNGTKFRPGQVNEWLDCGNKDSTVFTNQRILEHHKKEQLISDNATIINSIIIPPCYIGKNTRIENSVIGPHVSVGLNTQVKNSLIRNSIVQRHSVIEGENLQNSMVGNYVDIRGESSEVNIGDYTTMNK